MKLDEVLLKDQNQSKNLDKSKLSRTPVDGDRPGGTDSIPVGATKTSAIGASVTPSGR